MSKLDENVGVLRVVLDTNVLIDSIQDPFNAQAQLIEAARDGKVLALATPAIKREYRRIVDRLVESRQEQEELNQFLLGIEEVDPVRVDAEIDDEEDYKFLQAAVGGEADLLVTNDKHLLDASEVESTRIVRPTEALAALQEESGGEWGDWVRGMGI